MPRKAFLLRSRYLHIILLALIYIILDHEYRNFVVSHFSHLNFSYACEWGRWVAGLAVFLAAMVSMVVQKPSPYMHATSVVFVVLLLIPNLILFQYMPTDPLIPLSILIFIILIRLRTGQVRWVLSMPSAGTRMSPLILSVLAILFLIPVIATFGYTRPSFTDLLDTARQYEIRELMNQRMTAATSYSYGQLTRAILPALLLIGIIARRYLFSAAALLATAYLFVINPHKTTLVMLLPLVIFLFFRDFEKKATLFLGLLIIGIFISMIISHAWSILPESLLVRRSLFTQAFLTHAHFDFFRGEPLFFSHSFLSSWIPYPYALSPAYQIGEVYFGSAVMSCNTGFIGDGFMNLGYPGVFLFVILAASVFHIIDQLQLQPAYFGLTFLIIFQMVNTSLPTLVLTHGLLMLLLIMAFMLREKPPAAKPVQAEQ